MLYMQQMLSLDQKSILLCLWVSMLKYIYLYMLTIFIKMFNFFKSIQGINQISICELYNYIIIYQYPNYLNHFIHLILNNRNSGIFI